VIAAGLGLAASPSPEGATLDACLEALGQSGSDHADLALVFTTGEALDRAHELLHVVRTRGLFGVPGHDVTLIRERLGDFPLVGFFGNGEFAPIGRKNFFHTYTGALVVFPER
jgi:hypothetical protein